MPGSGVGENMAETIIIGREHINAISYAVNDLIPVLAESDYQMLPNGSLSFGESGVPEALDRLRAPMEEVISVDVRRLIAEKSGLGWDVFFGHVAAWWFPQRRRWGFLRAFADRASLFGVDLRLHWNAGRVVHPLVGQPGNETLFWGGLMGLGAAVFAIRIFDVSGLTAALLVATGVVMARVSNRVRVKYECGDPLCRAPRTRGKSCRSCGALWP